ncbi:amidohydrolase family protein [Lichenihabitans psoromatis]|uniref:amidohydrolase family protein n=1 Tax=Lichenihabitans psoromatis TaxID=2528642 RepID=UPI001FDEDB2F|nr:amidohydrolase family protein [Lichenihabitans psoromatis]
MIDEALRIDAHQHYWDPARGDYFWMVPGGKLDRVFAPSDLRPCLARNKIGGTVLIQAAPTLEETDYLLDIADREPTVMGVVGWIDFEDRSHLAALERFRKNPKFKGIRPMIQDIADPKWVMHPNLSWAFDALVEYGLCFDALLHPQHILPLLKRLLRYPNLKVVIDHGARPQIRDEAFSTWAADIARLARESSAFVKLSGLTTEAGPEWTEHDLEPYASHILNTFGPERVMFGSDWPVCLRASSYDRWVDAASALTASYSDAERAAVFGGNAKAFYGLDDLTAAVGPGLIKA